MTNTQVCKPSPNDVLFGKGHKCQNHHGNCYFREAVNKNKIQYAQATKTTEKDAISKHVHQSVKRLNPPGRFLKKADDGKYYASSEKDALIKIKQALRENKRDVKDMIRRVTPIATKGTKRPATSALSRTKNASVITKDDVMKMTNLILGMED
jgi:hypothetical protein